MTPSCASAQAVKSALSSGNASTSTVDALRSLLGIENIGSNSSVTTSKKSRTASHDHAGRNTLKILLSERNQIRSVAVNIHEDEATPITPKARCTLATEVINITLKELTSSRKPNASTVCNTGLAHGPSVSATSQHSDKFSTTRALLPRSDNPISPPKRKLGGEYDKTKGAANVPELLSTHTIAVAECSTLAFSSLRTAKPFNTGHVQPAIEQLLNGMLILCERLLFHDIKAIAIRELRAIKKWVEASRAIATPTCTGSRQRPTTHPKTVPEKESIADLLNFNNIEATNIPLLSINKFQVLVLRAIAAIHKPDLIEATITSLCSEHAGTPLGVILEQLKRSNDEAKAAKQLETLSTALLLICPSVHSTMDGAALDQRLHARPLTVLRLQTHALVLRQRWWALANHHADAEKEFIEPFTRYLKAFARRSASGGSQGDTYHHARACYETLFSKRFAVDVSPTFEIHNILYNMAEVAKLQEEVLALSDLMEKDLHNIETTHARYLAVSLRRQRVGAIDLFADLDRFAATLEGQISGQSADYEMLLAECSRLLPMLACSATRETEKLSAAKTCRSSTCLAQRIYRSHPGRVDDLARKVICEALRHNAPLKDRAQWVTADAARLFIQGGVLKTIMAASATAPLMQAWVSSPEAIVLGEILEMLVYKAIEHGHDFHEQLLPVDPNVSAQEQGLLLEWQLSAALKHSKRKFTPNLRKFLPELFRRLADIYTLEKHPLRRRIVAIHAFRLHGIQPDLMLPKELHPWNDLPATIDDLWNDKGLEPFLEDISAATQVARAATSGDCSWEALKSSLLTWQRIMKQSHDKTNLTRRVYDPSMFDQQLCSIAGYFGATGRDQERLAVLRLAVKLNQILQPGSPNHIDAVAQTAEQLCSMGYAESAGLLCSGANELLGETSLDLLATLQLRVTDAECLVEEGKHEQSRAILEQAQHIQKLIVPEKVTRSQRTVYEKTHARAWMVQSKLSQGCGRIHDALYAAKYAAKIVNSAWQRLERREGTSSTMPEGRDMSECEDASVNDTVHKISKLCLTNKDTKTAPMDSNRGAAYWPLVPVACTTLMRLSELFAHHGLFAEAKYYSERTTSIANAIPGSLWSSRARSHQIMLLAQAGLVEDAELCLAADETHTHQELRLASVERYRAEAALKAKESVPSEAVKLLGNAQTVLSGLLIVPLTDCNESDIDGIGKIASSLSAGNISVQDDKSGILQSCEAEAKTTARKASSKLASAAKSKRTAKGSATAATASLKANKTSPLPFVLEKLQAELMLEKALLLLSMGESDIEVTKALAATIGSELSRRRQLQVLYNFGKVEGLLQTDLAFNALLESSISLPSLAVVQCDSNGPDDLAPSSTSARSNSRRDKVQKSSSKPNSKEAGFKALLQEARNHLLEGCVAKPESGTVADVHKEGGLITQATTLLSSTDAKGSCNSILLAQTALNFDLPRMHAQRCEQGAVERDVMSELRSKSLEWPSSSNNKVQELFDAKAFQSEYIDILPKNWTAVSLCLAHDGTELYAARYRSGEPPFIVRLPFSRSQEDALSDEIFDFWAGKAELQDIIESCNRSCHNGTDMSAKGAKTGWWQDRESLDRRLHQLLINIENIWFGGFKGVLSPQAAPVEPLNHFRKALDAILCRYLPSRKPSKATSKRLPLEDSVLKLFVNLGFDQDGTIDLDEPIVDLLYFVVDILQFSGERNAYDEIDFDSMTLDVLDALREYHDMAAEDFGSDQHLILVLDKRLQAFPWESLPFLQSFSTSRVGNLLSLRERILAMRPASLGGPMEGDNQYRVDCKTGTVILNPSSDLSKTQATLEPALSELRSGKGNWKSIVNKAPSEADLKSALEESAITLYFGHGAGSQYIRTRTVKKLKRCSDVVWLMGCSSGAVTEFGDFEPQNVPSSYLISGNQEQNAELGAGGKNKSNKQCLAVLANLWDVTDKDIDRFSLAVGEEWGLWPAAVAVTKQSTKAPVKRERLVTPTTPKRNPRTPKATKTPASARTSSRSRSKSGNEGTRRPQSLSEAVAKSRDACYLRYLNGAAPVIYGVPVYLES